MPSALSDIPVSLTTLGWPCTLEQVRQSLPGLVPLDLTMPVMDGFAVLHRLRELPDCADIPVVVLSAKDITVEELNPLSEADAVPRKGDTSLRDLATEVRKLDNRQTDAARKVASREPEDV